LALLGMFSPGKYNFSILMCFSYVNWTTMKSHLEFGCYSSFGGRKKDWELNLTRRATDSLLKLWHSQRIKTHRHKDTICEVKHV
jgi:hypothetical protein